MKTFPYNLIPIKSVHKSHTLIPEASKEPQMFLWLLYNTCQAIEVAINTHIFSYTLIPIKSVHKMSTKVKPPRGLKFYCDCCTTLAKQQM